MMQLTEEQRKALIEWSRKYLLDAFRTVENHPNSEAAKANLALRKIALAVLEAEPVTLDNYQLDAPLYQSTPVAAPAINLAELVPDAMPSHEKGAGIDATAHWCDGYNSCRAAILRNIEEAQ